MEAYGADSEIHTRGTPYGMTAKKHGKLFDPTICVTRNCNLNCVYCYQKHKDAGRMDFPTAKRCVDQIFTGAPDYACDGVLLKFMGGEPLLEFDLLRQVYEYVHEHYPDVKKMLFATTNGTLLNDEMKAWFHEHRQGFYLGLSIDGTPEVHNHNRSGSFEQIDTGFFAENWPEQGVKLTISAYSIPRLAESVAYIHSLGFQKVRGMNLAEGNFRWDAEEVVRDLVRQLKELVEFYAEHDSLYNQMFDKQFVLCEAKDRRKMKWCGTGVSCLFFDVDGTRYPCSYFTPMTFSAQELQEVVALDFTNEELFADDKCFRDCYIYPLCPTCAGANYQTNGAFGVKNEIHCRTQKLISLFAAELEARKIIQNPERYDSDTTYFTIRAIEEIRSRYYDEFKSYGL